MHMYEQGDIIKVSGLEHPALVISNNFFNSSGMAMVCPILSSASEGPLHIYVESKRTKGFVLCEQVRYVDLNKRAFNPLGRISYYEMMNISDAIQGIFEY